MNTYIAGNPAELEATITSNGAPVDPGTIQLQITDPNGNVTTIPGTQLTHTGTGTYQYSFDTTGAAPGTWGYEFISTGAGQSVGVGFFRVEALPVPGAGLPRIGPCASWVTGQQVLAEKYPDNITVDLGTATEMAQTATEVLYNLSGQQFSGQCGPVVVRPLARPADGDTRGLVGRIPSGYVAVWGWSSAWGQPGSGAASHYGTASPPEVDLGAYPVTKITQVKLDGVVIPPAEYYLQDYRRLVRVRPTASSQPTERYGWPTAQIMDLPDTEPGTFSVTYYYGTPPPQSGVTAALKLAQNLVLSRLGGNSAIPQRVTSISRAGESMAVVDVEDIVAKGMTGIYEVDLFIRAFNPTGQIRRPIAWSPDAGRPRRNPAGLA